MTDEKKKGPGFRARVKNFRQKLGHTYRLAIMRPDTLEEVTSYKLSLLNIYILACGIFVAFGIVVVLLIAFTPLRQYMPGYAEVSTKKELTELQREIVELERTMAAQKAYMENFKRMINGDVTTEEDAQALNQELENLDSLIRPESPEVDRVLRDEVVVQTTGGSYQATTRLPNSNTPFSQIFFVPPINGEVSLGYTPERNHFGIDVLAPKNTPVKAALDGYVFFSDWTLETGNTVGIQHANNIITFYKHNSSLLKKAGSFVEAGEAIAIIGNTGTLSNGTHLHFELWLEGKSVDPTQFIQF